MLFTDELKKKSEKEHEGSNKFVMAALSLSFTDRRVYRLALQSFYHVFKTIEDQLEEARHDCEALQMVYFPQLLRAPLFEEDVEYFFGDEDLPDVSEQTCIYIENIKQDVARDPLLLIGYLQTMQMAILSGGQRIRPMIVRILRLQKTLPSGVQGLCWPEGFNTAASLDLYRDRLNNLALTREQKDDIINVKQKVFALNDKLIAEVTGSAESKQALRGYLEKAGLVLLMLLALYLLYRFVLQGLL